MSKRSGKKVAIKFRPFAKDNPKAKIRGTRQNFPRPVDIKIFSKNVKKFAKST